MAPHSICRESHTHCLLVADGHSQVLKQKRMTSALHRVDWALVTTPRKMVRPWFQTNQDGVCSTATFSPASAEEGCTGNAGCLAPPEGRMNRANSLQSSGGLCNPQIDLQPCGFDMWQKIWVACSKSVRNFGLGDQVVARPHRNNGFPWRKIKGQGSHRKWRTIDNGYFSFFYLAHCFRLSPCSWGDITRTQVCACASFARVQSTTTWRQSC